MLWKKPIKNSLSDFNILKKQTQENGKKLADMSLAEMDVFWNEAKKIHR